ncbi:exonuclease SbcCD subunit D [Pseudogracilibacillus sp. SO30301A]|uniref:exonuclease SbcCD subunit D n=1 Tax=Pseudogracilibacillus sp. SO30301A TaxID=3098291 RepID=UPI00300E0D67
MKFFHTADWHLGKLVQGVYMTEDQEFVLHQFIDCIKEEKPDAVVIAGDLYDRAVPPTEAVQLLNNVLDEIVLELKTPVIAIAGNHDSPSRLHFGSRIMNEKGFHVVGQFEKDAPPVILNDEFGEVHFHLVPYSDPSIVRNVLNDDTIKTHDDATMKIIENIQAKMDKNARHVYVGHAFVTPHGESQDNTSESERPLSIGGAEYVNASHFEPFHYTALGHLHQAHYVQHEKIRYAGSLLKYSISEENHNKGYFIVEMDGTGNISAEKRLLTPRRDIRTVETNIDDLLTYPINEDYVFVKLVDEAPVLSAMEKVRSVFPNAMHVERKNLGQVKSMEITEQKRRSELSDVELFKAFYKEVKGYGATEETEKIFTTVLDDLLKIENETMEAIKQVAATK